DDVFKERIKKSFKVLAEKFSDLTLRLSNCDKDTKDGIILFDPCGNCIVRGTSTNSKDNIFKFGCEGLKDKILSVLDYRAHILRYSLTGKNNVR
ncbi:MAG: hypothetical protein K2N30_00490, partial [Clostridia bacterium]|nr:hypothetical protein [Clostridia bacterium]